MEKHMAGPQEQHESPGSGDFSFEISTHNLERLPSGKLLRIIPPYES
jgi:hypothetical protein